PCISATVVLGTVGHAALPVGLPQVTLVTFRFATAGSVKIAPLAPDGPALLTPMVYVVVPPALTLVTPSVLVIERSATRLTVSVSVALLLPGVGSVTPAGAAIVAVLAIEPVAL